MSTKLAKLNNTCMHVEDHARKSRADVSITRIHDHLVEFMALYNSPSLAGQTRDCMIGALVSTQKSNQ